MSGRVRKAAKGGGEVEKLTGSLDVLRRCSVDAGVLMSDRRHRISRGEPLNPQQIALRRKAVLDDLQQIDVVDQSDIEEFTTQWLAAVSLLQNAFPKARETLVERIRSRSDLWFAKGREIDRNVVETLLKKAAVLVMEESLLGVLSRMLEPEIDAVTSKLQLQTPRSSDYLEHRVLFAEEKAASAEVVKARVKALRDEAEALYDRHRKREAAGRASTHRKQVKARQVTRSVDTPELPLG